ncbi:MAG: ATP-binding protein [Porticoccus sp.]|nr:ATP-binding protein [Porticoccus sp.]
MIIDFTVSNFRSIRKKQTLSLFAESASNHLAENIARPGDEKIGVLRTVGIYGANASGKSNLLLAFEALRYIVCSSGDLKDGDTIPCYEPYLLAESSKTAPIEFEIEFFSKESVRFIYSVAFNAERILSESLDFYPSRSKANLFKRQEGDKWEDVAFGGHYKGGKKKFAFFDNNSYISKAGNSADAPELIRSIFNYFRTEIFHVGVNEPIGIFRWKNNQDLVNSIAEILSKVDTGIHGVSFKDQDVTEIKFPKDTPEFIRKRVLESESKKTVFLHRGDNGFQEEFTEDMESAGTTKLFNMLPMLMDALDDGGVLILDELDNSFHPHLAELIIKLFNDPKLNRKNSQLIFSTHNINLMSPSLLRRDQIWLTEKNNGETVFSSLDEFDKNTVKMDSPFGKWYCDGRFGAIPEIDFFAISKIIKDRIS